jgi:hypothetical protein
MNGAFDRRSDAARHDRIVTAQEKAMKKNVRKWMIAGIVAMMAAPALAGCVASVGPGYYHGYHDRGWHDRDGYHGRDGWHR